MKIGYPCINRTIGCQADRTFRLKSFSERRLIETVQGNLDCLLRILRYNVAHHILFFRITSDLAPFASHPVNRFDWLSHFAGPLGRVGDFIRTHRVRISMHPDQFNVINSPDEGVFERTVAELLYHGLVLDAMRLDSSARIQVHVGGAYGERSSSIKRFVERYRMLPETVRARLVIENDDRLYTLADCLRVSGETGVPVLFDTFHHSVNSSGETMREAFKKFTRTWRSEDGIPMVDYSSQATGADRIRKHALSLDLGHFEGLLKETEGYDFDVMLEIKDKETSALKAVEAARDDERFVSVFHRFGQVAARKTLQNWTRRKLCVTGA